MDKVSDINETVFLGSGPPIFYQSDCFIATWEKEQHPLPQRPDDRYQLDIEHGHFVGVDRFPADHTSHGVNVVVVFKNPVPTSITSINIDGDSYGNGVQGHPNENRTRWYFDVSPYYNAINFQQDIGLGSFYIDYMQGGTQVFPTDVIVSAITANDVGFRD
jgi:hypothetical protein